MANDGPVTEDITDGVNNMTVQDGQHQMSEQSSSQIKIESVLSGNTITVVQPTPLPQRGTKRQRTENGPSTSTQADLRDRYPIESKKPYLTCKTLEEVQPNPKCQRP